MIKFDDIDVYGFDAAMRGMRNPKRTKYHPNEGDSTFCELIDDCLNCPAFDASDDDEDYCDAAGSDGFVLGVKDRRLALRLATGGPVHAKYRRQIQVWVDITAPLYWWKEFDTYKVGTTANSCSTMHMLMADPFEIEDFSVERMTAGAYGNFLIQLNFLNDRRKDYMEQDKWLREHEDRTTTNEDAIDHHLSLKQMAWNDIVQSLGSNYNQTRTVNLNYEVLTNIWNSRRYHKLQEWRDFCDNFIKELPYQELITGEDHDGDKVL